MIRESDLGLTFERGQIKSLFFKNKCNFLYPLQKVMISLSPKAE